MKQTFNREFDDLKVKKLNPNKNTKSKQLYFSELDSDEDFVPTYKIKNENTNNKRFIY
jgi:hypothetical protein